MESRCFCYITGTGGTSASRSCWSVVQPCSSCVLASGLCSVFWLWHSLPRSLWVDACHSVPLFSVALLGVPCHTCHCRTQSRVKDGSSSSGCLRTKWLAVGHVISSCHRHCAFTPDALSSRCSSSWLSHRCSYHLATGVTFFPACVSPAIGITCPWPPSVYIAHLCNFPGLCLHRSSSSVLDINYMYYANAI